jgi:hypothetical protein
MLLPAFSTKSVIAKEQTIYKYIDIFVQKMKEIGKDKERIELKKVGLTLTSSPSTVQGANRLLFSGQTGWRWISQPT